MLFNVKNFHATCELKERMKSECKIYSFINLPQSNFSVGIEFFFSANTTFTKNTHFYEKTVISSGLFLFIKIISATIFHIGIKSIYYLICLVFSICLQIYSVYNIVVFCILQSTVFNTF